ncbi:MAG: HNH endonuclease signature motif containing protein [Bdellovibrionota bacterium]
MTKKSAWSLLLSATALFSGLVTNPTFADSDKRFPIGPDADMTPGELCQHADQIRYPEKIKYCERHVSTSLKKRIIKIYDAEFGFSIGKMDRAEFKIDHYIPLCMGGSNDISNLWPQHRSVYQYTDRLEEATCIKMREGRLKQAEAVEIIKAAKANLDQADEYLDEVNKR